MQKNNFDQVVAEILQTDTRFDVQAYRFVREGLDYTLKLHKRTQGAAPRHVTGPELLEGLRQYTLKEFGPMGKMVLNEWGVSRCEDFGAIVFSLVQRGILGKSDNDKPEDFAEIFTFDEAFVKPFLPEKAPARAKRPARSSRSRLPKDPSVPNSASEPAE
jgi:uncharacterized repeat protein (TIGR04138 family)